MASAYKWPRIVGNVVEITQEQADYMLEVLPPIYGPGFFGMGECAEHCRETGKPRYHWWIQRGGRSFIVLGTKDEAREAFGNPSNFDLDDPVPA